MVEIQEIQNDEILRLVVVGEVDASSSIYLDNAIRSAMEAGQKKIMVDASQLNYISSAGLGVFMSYLEDFKDQNIAFVVYGLQEKVQHVFELIGLENLLKLVRSESEANDYLNETQA